MANDSDGMEQIIEYFQVACYAELAEYIQQLSNANELEEILNLLDTHHIRRIVRNSVKSQAKLIGSFYEHLSVENQSIEKTSSTLNTGHIKTRKEAEKILNSNFTWLDSRLKNIDDKMKQFRSKLRRWSEDASNESFESGMVGGIIGALLLGPVGAFAGSFLGSSMNSGPAASEFQREYEGIVVDFNHLLNEVKESLDECLEMSGDLFGQVAVKFSSGESERSRSLPERDPGALPGQKRWFNRLLPWGK